MSLTIHWETLDLISAHLLADKVIMGDENRMFSEADYRRRGALRLDRPQDSIPALQSLQAVCSLL